MSASLPLDAPPAFGERLRVWRQRRRRSQLDLALDADVSSRHLSFVETGRARPSRDLVLRLAEELGLPLRERNALLLAAGYAPAYPERPLADPALAPVRAMIERVLAAHEPFPAVAIDGRWTLLAANASIPPLLEGCEPSLLAAPVNVLRLSLHPKGLAPRIVNFAEWREHLLSRLRHQAEDSMDAGLHDLLAELSSYPSPAQTRSPDRRPVVDEAAGIAIPLRLATPAGILSFLSTSMVFGTPRDVFVSELAVEAFLPADEATAAALRAR